MNGKLLFLITLAAAVAFSAVAFVAGTADPEAALGLRVGLGLAGVWALWLVVLLYLAGGAISQRRHPGEAATSIVLAFLLTPLVVAAPVTALVGSLASGVSEAFAPAEGAIVPSEDGLDPLVEEFVPPEDFVPPEPPGAFLTEEEVELYYLPEGVSRDDLTDEEWAGYYECVTVGYYPDECSIGSAE